jgi:hypothetical protein
MKQADAIREFANTTYIEPARRAGLKRVTIRAGDVHSQMGLRDRMPAVAGGLGATTFATAYRLKCVDRTGPHNGADLTLTFEIQP